MAGITVTLVLPSGGTRTAEVPDDVEVKELIPELTTSLELPTTGPDGRPMGYRLDSKALGRELQEEETLAEAGVPEDDHLVMTASLKPLLPVMGRCGMPHPWNYFNYYDYCQSTLTASSNSNPASGSYPVQVR